jgi:hypothetical protein
MLDFVLIFSCKPTDACITFESYKNDKLYKL